MRTYRLWVLLTSLLLSSCGTVRPVFSTVTGTVFFDSKRNRSEAGVQQPLRGWQVYLDLNSNAALDANEPRTLTDGTGRYTLTAIATISRQVTVIHEGHLGYGASLSALAESSVQPQIVGGSRATDGQFPFVVALLDSRESDSDKAYFCAASLIAPQWIATAAHCLLDASGRRRTAASLKAAIGISTISNPLERTAITQIIVHPAYTPRTKDGDIAVLKLGKLQTATPIAVPEPDDIALEQSGMTATIIGWGNTSSGSVSTYPAQLQQAQLPLVSPETCTARLGGGITDRMLCAGFEAGGVDTCQGDSGGPLIVTSGGLSYLAGITSHGIGCAQARSPSVYTRVSRFGAWLETSIGRGGRGVQVVSFAPNQVSRASFAVQP